MRILLFVADVADKQVGDKIWLEEIPNCNCDAVLLEQQNLSLWLKINYNLFTRIDGILLFVLEKMKNRKS
jgi:hypothetical protein